MIKILLIGFTGVFLGISTPFFWAQAFSRNDDDVYKKLVSVGGIITTTEIESSEETPAQGKTILFKRLDCKNCVAGVKSGDEGIYEIFLSEGKYQIIVSECGPDNKRDCIAPKQSRFINVSANSPQFDIKLVHSKKDNEITLPKNIVIPSPSQ